MKRPYYLYPALRPVSSQRRFLSQQNLFGFEQRNQNYVLCSQNIGPKDGNMVLQLVLPADSQNISFNEDSNYLSGSSIEDIIHPPITYDSGPDTFSTLNLSNDNDLDTNNNNNNNNHNNNEKYENSSTSRRCCNPTTPSDKGRHFRKHLTCILSSMYALFIVTLGLVVYIGDVFIDDSTLAETFSLYLVLISLSFILYLIIDIRVYMKKMNRYREMNSKKGLRAKDIKTEKIKSPLDNYQFDLEHHYCLSKERNSANFYLKIGAAGFCIGHLIHSGLLLGYQIVFLTSEGDTFYGCATVATLILDIVYPIYSFLLLYFIFKYSNVIINRHAPLARFGVMHCISSSLCFWVWTILRETIESLSTHSQDDSSNLENDSDSREEAQISRIAPPSFALALSTVYERRGAQFLTNYLNTSLRHFTSICQGEDGLSFIYRNYSPYLYPFTVEYSILVVGVLFVIWQSIGKCKENLNKEEMSMILLPSIGCTLRDSSPLNNGNNDNLESNVVIHADCHSANKGLFGGIVIMVLTVVSIILFFIAIENRKYENIGVYVNNITSIIITMLMIISALLGYRQITKLDVNNGELKLLDDLLLFVCIPAFFLNGIFSIIPAVLSVNALSITQVIVEVVQVLIQTPLIIDGLRRASNSWQLRREKPGRELLTFLIVCNVAIWIMQTFEVKSHGLQDHRYDFYGRELWTIIGHMCIPLMMFYRFHSSVCLVDIWKYAYELAEE